MKNKKVNLHCTFDALVWAKEWMKIVNKNKSIPFDEGCMESWFAEALMAGWTVCEKKHRMVKRENPLNWIEKDNIKEKIDLAVGESSMCWVPRPSGVFDAVSAMKVSNELCDFILNEVEECVGKK
jgi:hypothetical protein